MESSTIYDSPLATFMLVLNYAVPVIGTVLFIILYIKVLKFLNKSNRLLDRKLQEKA